MMLKLLRTSMQNKAWKTRRVCMQRRQAVMYATHVNTIPPSSRPLVEDDCQDMSCYPLRVRMKQIFVACWFVDRWTNHRGHQIPASLLHCRDQKYRLDASYNVHDLYNYGSSRYTNRLLCG